MPGRSRCWRRRPGSGWADRSTSGWTTCFASDDVDTAPLTAPIAVLAAALQDLHGDPADRVLVATSASLDVQLMTKDRLIHRYANATGGVRVVW